MNQRSVLRTTLRRIRVTGILSVALIGVMAACDDKRDPSAPAGLTLSITPNPATVSVNGSVQMTAVSKDFNGTNAAITPVWSVISGGGTINSSGVFTAGTTLGTYANTVRVTSGALSSTATINVVAGPLANIVVTPNPVTLGVGGTQQYTATGTDALGNPVTFTPTWSVVAGGGSISATGLFTAGTVAGSFANTVRASSGAISGTASVNVVAGPLATIVVTPNPATLAGGAAQQFTAVGRDASGNAVTITPTWSVTAGGGTINSSGNFTAGNTAGTFTNTVRATSGGISGNATVIVTAGPLANIVVTPNPATLAINGTQQFTATGTDAAGNNVSFTPTWSVTAGGGTIAANGVFTAGTATGTFANTVRASAGTISGNATVVVTPGAATTLSVSPDPATVSAGATQTFTAVARDAGGNIVPVTPTWSVTNGGGTINSTTGVFTAGTTTGTFSNTVRAASGTLQGFATVVVTAAGPPVPGPATTLVVSPDPATVATGQTQTFTAVARDANGNIVVVTPTWSVINGGGTINSTTGVFTAGAVTGTFSNTVRATSGTLTDDATVIVSATPNPGPSGVNLGAAAANGIMAGTAVTCVTGGIVNADVSISPGNTLTGFGPCVITGTQHLADAVAAQAQIDLTTAYNTLAGMPCVPANAISGDLGGTTKAAGVYCTASGIGVTGTLTLDGGGDPNAVFVFQAGTSLTTAGNIVLINGAQAGNVYWQVGSSATIGTASQWQGNILALTSITMVTGATLNGRALARNGAVTLGTGNVINLP